MADIFKKQSMELNSPFVNAFSITANNSTVFSQPTRAIYIGGAGNLKVMFSDKNNANNVVTFNNIPVGVYKFRVQRVYSGNTTASNIIGLY